MSSWSAVAPRRDRRGHDLARHGRQVALLDKAGRIKPCGGAIPPRAIRDFDIPDHMIVARVNAARMIVAVATARWTCRSTERLCRHGRPRGLRRICAVRAAGRGRAPHRQLRAVSRDGDGTGGDPSRGGRRARSARAARPLVIGADGAQVRGRAQDVQGADKVPYVFAYHEIIAAPSAGVGDYAAALRRLLPGQAVAGLLCLGLPAWQDHERRHGLRRTRASRCKAAVAELREAAGLRRAQTIRREGAPIPLKPLKRWDNGRDVVLAGDAAGVVAPASGEGIYYAMLGGRLAADAADDFLADRRRPRAGHGAQALHEGAWPRLLDPRDHAVFLVLAATSGASTSSRSARTRTCSA